MMLEIHMVLDELLKMKQQMVVLQKHLLLEHFLTTLVD
jgi:hypothetical protein